MNVCIRVLSLVVAACGLVGCSSGGAFKDKGVGAPAIVKESFVYEGETRPYSVYTPANYNPKKKYPAILFLHGLFEGGSNGTSMTAVGLGPAIRENPERFDCVVVFPQTPGSWRDTSQQPLAMATLDEAMKRYSIDGSRITLTGLSTGGAAVWNLGAKYPNRFAALAPLCAYSAYDDVRSLTRHPVWAVSNSTDPFVPAANTHEMTKRINDAGGDVRKTIFSGFGHNCWDQAYADEKFVAWLQSPGNVAKAQTAGRAQPMPARQ